MVRFTQFARRSALTLTAAAALSLSTALPASAVPAGDVPVTASGETPRLTPVAGGLIYPWSLAVLPGGDMLVTERNGADNTGALRVIRDGVLLPDAVAGVPDALAHSQGGLMEVLPHPDFETNGLLYLSLSVGTRRENAARVVRGRFDAQALTFSDVETIFEATPKKRAGAHFGGRMAFLADGTLLITLGDGFDYREGAQDLGGHFGKIVRLNDDGTIPADNPFQGQDGALADIWSYGHRNVQGIAVDPVTGAVWTHEHGPQGGDELNLTEAGKNYGWPVITYGRNYSGSRVSPFTERDGMEQPLVYWTPSIAPSGMALYTGSAFPGWTGDLFISALVRPGHIVRIDLEDGAVVGQEILFDQLGRIRSVHQGPEGELYLLTDSEEGQVLRVDPAQ